MSQSVIHSYSFLFFLLKKSQSDSYVQSFTSLDDAAGLTLRNKNSLRDEDFLDAVLEHRGNTNTATTTTNDGELAAFCNYACAFPNSCLCLIDTYDTLQSGLVNFIAVAKALDDFGYVPKGVRLDSGDLVALSNACRAAFDRVLLQEPDRAEAFSALTIVASNDINEAVLDEFSKTRHSLTAFGIGTNLVTCQAQPALGCVYKLGEQSVYYRVELSFVVFCRIISYHIISCRFVSFRFVLQCVSHSPHHTIPHRTTPHPQTLL
jgi:nicotinate phosphoribosyltransferase